MNKHLCSFQLGTLSNLYPKHEKVVDIVFSRSTLMRLHRNECRNIWVDKQINTYAVLILLTNPFNFSARVDEADMIDISCIEYAIIYIFE